MWCSRTITLTALGNVNLLLLDNLTCVCGIVVCMYLRHWLLCCRKQSRALPFTEPVKQMETLTEINYKLNASNREVFAGGIAIYDTQNILSFNQVDTRRLALHWLWYYCRLMTVKKIHNRDYFIIISWSFFFLQGRHANISTIWVRCKVCFPSPVYSSWKPLSPWFIWMFKEEIPSMFKKEKKRKMN